MVITYVYCFRFSGTARAIRGVAVTEVQVIHKVAETAATIAVREIYHDICARIIRAFAVTNATTAAREVYNSFNSRV